MERLWKELGFFMGVEPVRVDHCQAVTVTEVHVVMNTITEPCVKAQRYMYHVLVGVCLYVLVA